MLPKNLDAAFEQAVGYVNEDLKDAAAAAAEREEHAQASSKAKTLPKKRSAPKRKKVTPKKAKAERKAKEPEKPNDDKSSAAARSKPDAADPADLSRTPNKKKEKMATPKRTPKTSPKKRRMKKNQDQFFVYHYRYKSMLLKVHDLLLSSTLHCTSASF